MDKRSSRRVVAGFSLMGVVAALTMLFGAPSAQATTGRIEFALQGTGQTYTGSWSRFYNMPFASGADEEAVKGLSGSTMSITFTTSGGLPAVYCSWHPIGNPPGVTEATYWRIDGGAWNIWADRDSNGPTTARLCAQPSASVTAGQHTIDLTIAGGAAVILDYLEAPDLAGPTTTSTSTTSTSTTSTSTTSIPTTTTTSPIDGPCRWEWGGLQELDPQPCPDGQSIALSAASRPAGRTVGGTDLLALALLVVSGTAVLRMIGRPKAG